MHAREGTYPSPPRRICSVCKYEDRSIIPPVSCPRCHFAPENAMNEQNMQMARMNRKERRKQDAERRAQERKVNRQIARETAKSGGKYEAG